MTLGKDVATGALLILIALVFGIGALDLPIGTPARMGPGFFPLMLSVLLLLLGAAIVAGGTRRDQPIAGVELRGAALIALGPVVFGLTVRGLGLVPSLAAAVLLSAFASRLVRPVFAVAVTAALVLFCLALFVWGLGLPLRPFGHLFD